MMSDFTVTECTTSFLFVIQSTLCVTHLHLRIRGVSFDQGNPTVFERVADSRSLKFQFEMQCSGK